MPSLYRIDADGRMWACADDGGDDERGGVHLANNFSGAREDDLDVAAEEENRTGAPTNPSPASSPNPVASLGQQQQAVGSTAHTSSQRAAAGIGGGLCGSFAAALKPILYCLCRQPPKVVSSPHQRKIGETAASRRGGSHGGGRARSRSRGSSGDDNEENENTRTGTASATQGDDEDDDDDDRFLCRVSLRTLHSVLRGRKGVRALRIRSLGLPPDGGSQSLDDGDEASNNPLPPPPKKVSVLNFFFLSRSRLSRLPVRNSGIVRSAANVHVLLCWAGAGWLTDGDDPDLLSGGAKFLGDTNGSQSDSIVAAVGVVVVVPGD